MKPIIFHVSNLHCESCVQTIQTTLGGLSPPPIIKVSIAFKTVTAYVEDDQDVDSESILSDVLEGEGFILNQRPARIASPQSQKHLQNCIQCRQEGDHLLRLSTTRSVRVTMSVGGMTCSACSTSATSALSIPGVRDIAVSLLNNCATGVVDDESLVEQMKLALEDCGFDVVVTNIQPIEHFPLKDDNIRTVSLRIEGMVGSNCPKNILAAMGTLQVTVTQVFTLENPMLTLSYTPQPPLLTIRSIIGTIKGTSPRLEVTIWHPPTAEERSKVLQRRERQGYLFRLFFTVLIAIPTFIIGVVCMMLVKDDNPARVYLSEPVLIGNVSRAEWALFFLSTPVMFWSASVFHRRAIKEIVALWRRGSKIPVWKRFIRFGSMNMLVSSGVSVAYGASVALLGLTASQPRQEGMTGSLAYFDSVVFLTMFLLAGRYLEAFSKGKTSEAISSLGSLRPDTALLVSDPSWRKTPIVKDSRDLEKAAPDIPAASLSSSLATPIGQVPTEWLEVGDVVRILAGSSPPVDGVIVEGEHGLFDESSLTGESKPVKKFAGDTVFVGTVNLGTVVHIRATNVAGTNMLDQIIQIVRDGQTRRAPIERVADKVTAYFVPLITLFAILTWLLWLTFGLTGRVPSSYLDIALGGWPFWSLQFAIAVFVVACPCGIGLAAPTALLVGSGLAARFGILSRGGDAFQEMSSVDVVVFDKTGTLTEGRQPTVSDAEYRLDGWKQERILGIAAELELASSHVIGKAIQEYCVANGSQHQHGSSFEEFCGRGLRARFDDIHTTAIIGNAAWMEENNITEPERLFCTEPWKRDGKTVVFLALRDDSLNSAVFRIVAVFGVTDQPRPEAAKVVHWLQQRGVQVYMLTGDHPETAAAVARTVGIPSPNVIAGILPQEKANHIQRLQRPSEKQRLIVAMVGDGINDSPALAVADVGVAIGSGSDVAISSASFVLLSSSLSSVPVLLSLSKCVIRRVKFNFAWAMIYNLLAIPVAAGAIYPFGHARLDPVWASLAMALSSVSVVCSSLALKLYRPPKV